MTKKEKATSNIALFEHQEVRRVWHENQWWFAVIDVIQILAESTNPSDYIKKMRIRDGELNKGWGQIATPLALETKGGAQKRVWSTRFSRTRLCRARLT